MMIVHRSMQVYEVVGRAEWLRGVIRGTTFEDSWRAWLHDERSVLREVENGRGVVQSIGREGEGG
jgi:hypothetical protein